MRNLFRKLLSACENACRRDAVLIALLLVPLIVVIGYGPSFLQTGIHTLNLLQPASDIAQGYLYTHACIIIASWSPIWYGPMTPYLLAPFAAVSVDPLMVYGVAGALAIAGGILLFLLCRDFFGRSVAAVSLWAYSTMAFIPAVLRKMHHQSFLPFFVILTLYSLFKMRFERRWGYCMPFAVGVAFALQNHVSTIPLLILVCFVPWREFLSQRRHAVACFLVLLFLFLPYLSYLYEERQWILQTAARSLRRDEGGAAEGMITLSNPLALPVLGAFFQPVGYEGILPRAIRLAPFFYRGGVALMTVLASVALAGSALSEPLRRLFSCGSRHAILLLLLGASFAWLALFPYHERHHFIVPFITTIILAGAAVSWCISRIRSKIALGCVIALLIYVGAASALAFSIAIYQNLQAGRATTDSGLSVSEEREISSYVESAYPRLKGDRIISLDAESLGFSMHKLYSGQREPSLPQSDRAWREAGGCGPRARIPFLGRKSRDRNGALPSLSSMEAGPYNSTYLLIFRGESGLFNGTSLPSHRFGGDITLVDVTSPPRGAATIETFPTGQAPEEEHRLPLQYPVSLPLAFLHADVFPPLVEEEGGIVYKYSFNATPGEGVRWFLYSASAGGYTATPLLDGAEILPAAVFKTGQGFAVRASPGEHEFTLVFTKNQTGGRGPTGYPLISLFDIGEDPPVLDMKGI